MKRRARSAGIAAVVTTMVLANVPGTGVAAFARAVGLGQAWAVFAPDPVHAVVEVEGEIRYSDGTTELWRPPPPRAVAQETGYRWQLWTRELIRDDRSELWEPAARWLARTHAGTGRRPVTVTLRRRFAVLSAPGAHDRRLRWNEFDFFTLDVR